MKSLPRILFGVGALAYLTACPCALAAPAKTAAYAAARHALAYLEHSPEASDLRAEIETGPDDLATEKAAAKEAGLPCDPPQLQAPVPPDDRNAAPLYRQLGQLLKDHPLDLPDYAAGGMSTRHTYTAEQIAAVQKVRDSRSDVFALIHQAADKPQCVFSRDWDKGLAVTFPEYATMREAARLLETESYLLARRGLYVEAMSNQARGFRLAEQAGSDPSVISYLVGCACDAIAVGGMESILATAGPNTVVCAAVQREVLANRPKLSLRRSLTGELVMISANLDTARAMFASNKDYPGLSKKLPVVVLSSKDLPAFSPADRKFLRSLWAAQEAEYRHDLRTLIDNADQPIRVRKSVFSQPQETLDDAPRDPVKFVSNVLLPLFARTARNGDRVRTQEDVLLSASAALIARARSGDYPSTQPLTMLDSYNLKPLQYRAEGTDGFVVYSLGPDGTFDGGKPGDRRPAGQAYFRYPSVPDAPSDTSDSPTPKDPLP